MEEEVIDFDAVKSKIKKLEIELLRVDSNNFFEAVFMKNEIEKLNQCLRAFLGEPAYPCPGGLEEKVQKTVDTLGGIMPGQTLYYSNLGANFIFAMLWPWRDGERTTLKVALK